ncbi:NAD+ synthase [Patescibacteria group bacterium]|nr:NAD+ synthase [Patescibacteria group bacterium]MBU1682413.1 NAD+ synthase [Patescibacteria group bacterium]MBU1934749.1 NAD+ synthase [Patescibacteria group bacterium]
MTNLKVDLIISNLKSFFQKADKKKAILGLSGGVDSALVAKIAVMTLGKESVTALILPNEGLSSLQNIEDAENWAKELGIKYAIIPINDFLNLYNNLPWESSDFAKMNIQARVRANILYDYANSHGALVLGTGNKTEAMLGYFTKYGDGACDVRPIGNLFKTDVWRLAKEAGLPENIIQKTPSAELAPGQTDEGELGIKYTEIDEILKKFEQGKKPESENEKKIFERIENNRHKGEVPPTI